MTQHPSHTVPEDLPVAPLDYEPGDLFRWESVRVTDEHLARFREALFCCGSKAHTVTDDELRAMVYDTLRLVAVLYRIARRQEAGGDA